MRVASRTQGAVSWQLETPVHLWLLLHLRMNERDVESLGELADEIVESGTSLELGSWITENQDAWVAERRPALASVIEAAVRLSVGNAAELIGRVLRSDNPDPLVLSIAAQRVRQVPISDLRLRHTLWRSLKTVVEKWENLPLREGDLALALPSLPYLGGSDSLALLGRMIESGSPRLANAAALGVLDWAAGSVRGIEPPEEEEAAALHESLSARLSRQTPKMLDNFIDLRATLVWALAATARQQDLAGVASVVASSFKQPQGLEDAAAVRAGTLLVRRYRDRAVAALTDAFGGAQSSGFMRFFTALVETAGVR
jgi:hypothetical protein